MQSLAKGKNHFILYILTNITSISVAVKMEHNYYNNCTYMHITVTVTLTFIILLIFFSLLSQVALRFSHFFSLLSASFSFSLLLLAPTLADLSAPTGSATSLARLTVAPTPGLTVLITGAAGFVRTLVSMALKWEGDGVLGLDNFNGSVRRSGWVMTVAGCSN